jgi:hypothetical protein
MASFVARSAGYLDEIRRWRPTYEPLEFDVDMSWHNVTDGQGTYALGEEDAVGRMVVVIDEIARVGAFAVAERGVSTPYPNAPALTLHRGALADNGPAVAALDVNDSLAYDSTADGQFALADVSNGASTATIVGWLDDLASDPESFYVQLRTVDYQDGAIRGQLPDGGQDKLPAGAGFPGDQIFDPVDDLIGQLPGDGSTLLPLPELPDDLLDPLDPILDPLDPILDPLDPILDPIDPIDPITDPLDPITDPLDPITDPPRPDPRSDRPRPRAHLIGSSTPQGPERGRHTAPVLPSEDRGRRARSARMGDRTPTPRSSKEARTTAFARRAAMWTEVGGT